MSGKPTQLLPHATPNECRTAQLFSGCSLDRHVLSLPAFSAASTPRLRSLYSDFSRQKSSNPTAYHSNIQWWRKALEDLVSAGACAEEEGIPSRHSGDESGIDHDPRSRGSRLILHADDAMRNYLRIATIGRPSALGTIFHELKSSRSVYLQSDFMRRQTSINSGSTPHLLVRLINSVLGNPLWWMIAQLGLVDEEGVFTRREVSYAALNRGIAWHGEYVVMSLLEKAADTIVDMQLSLSKSPADALYSYAEFRATFACALPGVDCHCDRKLKLARVDSQLLLKFLERDRGLVLYDAVEGFIKFIADSRSDRTFTPIDRAILQLKSVLQSVREEVDLVQERIDSCVDQRTQRGLQGLLGRRLDLRISLESALITLECAVGDAEILRLYGSSTNILESLLCRSSLGRERVDRTLAALAQAMAEAGELRDEMRRIETASTALAKPWSSEGECASYGKAAETRHPFCAAKGSPRSTRAITTQPPEPSSPVPPMDALDIIQESSHPLHSTSFSRRKVQIAA
ncbi:hypothetical protein NMY22_g3353 [Coprinellus aureogranulatus]|nr:hypothetical protein NMY22_g3353 [Coprinellus aureogranulatus]